MRDKLLFLWAAAADLAIDGVLGVTWLTLMLSLLSVGVSAVPAAGIGIGLLWLTAMLARGLRLLERRRAEALYGIVIPPPPRRPRATTFGGWLGGVFVESFGATMWKGILHHATTTVLGLLFLSILAGSVDVLGRLVSGRYGELLTNPVVVSLAVVLALAVIVGYTTGAGLLDRRLSLGLLGAGANAALVQRVDRLQDARQGAVDAAQIERQRIERDLHDGVQPRLVSVAMTLGLARSKFADDPEGAKALLDEAHRETKESITELRHLARGIHPAVLTDRGLDAALSAVAQHCTVPTSVRVDLPERPSKEAEAVLYFAVSEALTNASKHSRASGCSVSVTASPGGTAPGTYGSTTSGTTAGSTTPGTNGSTISAGIRAVVFDNGVGGAAFGRGGGSGLAGMADRVRAAGGTLTVESPVGGPTVITVEVPCAF